MVDYGGSFSGQRELSPNFWYNIIVQLPLKASLDIYEAELGAALLMIDGMKVASYQKTQVKYLRYIYRVRVDRTTFSEDIINAVCTVITPEYKKTHIFIEKQESVNVTIATTESTTAPIPPDTTPIPPDTTPIPSTVITPEQTTNLLYIGGAILLVMFLLKK